MTTFLVSIILVESFLILALLGHNRELKSWGNSMRKSLKAELKKPSTEELERELGVLKIKYIRSCTGCGVLTAKKALYMAEKENKDVDAAMEFARNSMQNGIRFRI